MKKKLIEKFSQKIFNDPGLRISKDRAKDIIDMLYEMDLDATALQDVIYRLESYVYDSMLADIIDSLDKEKLLELVRQIAVEIINPECAPMNACKDKKYSENMIARMFSGFPEGKQFKAGDMVDVQIMRTGTWNHPNYGEIEVTSDTLKTVKKNFDDNARGIEIAVDENHEDDHKALGWFRELYIVADGLFSKIELTVMGADLLSQGAYKYFSPEIIIKKVDEETGDVIENLLVGGAFTNRPFFKLMDPIMANEVSGQVSKKDDKADSNQYLFIFKNNATMTKFMELVKKFGKADKLTKDDADAVKAAFAEIPADDKNNRLTATYESLIEKFEDPEADTTADDADKDDADADDKGADDKGDDADKDAEDKDDTTADDADKDDADKDEELDADGKPVVKATEGKDVTIKASELDALKKTQSDYAKLVKEARKTNISSEVSKLVFSEKEKTGIFNAKESNKIIDFVAQLSEPMEKKFFEIMATVKADLKKFTEEIGSGATSKAKANSAESVEERATQLMSEKKITKTEALRIAMKEAKFDTSKEDKADVTA